jgi:hypothetical protein
MDKAHEQSLTGETRMDEQPTEQPKPNEQLVHPRGALALTILYLAMIAALWLIVYFQLLGGGTTQ